MKPRHRRASFIVFALAGISIAAGLVLRAFRENLVFFLTPSQVLTSEAPIGRPFRIGGLVEVGSLKRDPDGLTTTFMVTDMVKSVRVVYKGILPDLFKEGRGCVAEGKIQGDTFYAQQVLAKHDENYRPPGS